jgi:ABC-type uncharacterized transport system substrate-binding protein
LAVRSAWRHTGGKPEGFDAHAAALVADGVDLFFCLTPGAAMAATRATSAILIVASGVSDPVMSGLVPSLARPRASSPACRPSTKPQKFELLINLKTALAFGVAVPSSLLWRADEVVR